MSRAIVRSMNLRRAVLKAGSRSLGGATGAVGGSTRRFAFQAPSLHPPSINAYGRQNQARYGGYGGLAVAVAGSVSLLVLSQVDGVEELLPSFAGQGSSPKRIQDFYALQNTKTLGCGQFGTVSTATEIATGEVVAVKCVPRSKVTEAHFLEEAEAHREAGSHPNVVGVKDVFSDDECWYMVMELAKGGELFDRLTTEGVMLEDDDVRSLLRETADAMSYIHDRGIVHGDVKPENMLLTAPPTCSVSEAVSVGTEGNATAQTHHEEGVCREKEGGDKEMQDVGGLGKVLLTDFGSSFRMRGGAGGGRRVTKEYTAAYSAPEVVTNSPAVDEKADVWSLGVVAYVLVKGYHPFDPTSEATDEEIMESIVYSEPDWEGLEPQAARLIRQMLSRNPENRPTAREVLQNSWLKAPAVGQAC